MIEEFHTKLRDTPHTWTEWSCSQLLQNTPVHPLADWGRVAKIPANNMGYEQAATLPVALQTMHNAVVTAGRLKGGETVLIQGASSGVGLMGLQIEALAQFVARTRWEDIPEPVQRHTKLVLLDTLGVILAGAERPEVRRLQEALAGTAGTAEGYATDAPVYLLQGTITLSASSSGRR